MPTVSDYGGTRYRRVKLSKENTYSFRCRDCEKLRYCTINEVHRASRPRCLECGGTLVENEISVKRRIKRTDTVALVKGKGVKKLTKLEHKKAASQSGGIAEIRCLGCGAGFVSTRQGISISAIEHLAQHLTTNQECLDCHPYDHPARRVIRRPLLEGL